MSAGLANRMFQYTYGIYLSQKGYDVYYDNSYTASRWKFEDITWSAVFPKAGIREAPPKLVAKLGGRYNVIDKIRRHYVPRTCSVIISNSALELIDERHLFDDRYLIGVFQNFIPAQLTQEIITERFKFSQIQGKKNLQFIEKIKAENAVAIHVRKGEDYQKWDYFKGTCPADYYEKAVAYIREKIDNPVFYLFTDNPKWARENFSRIPYTLINWNPVYGWGNHFDMQLMSLCKHNIIANSTYSWWGAFLNSNPKKIVVGPKEWFAHAMYGDESFVLPKKWVAF